MTEHKIDARGLRCPMPLLKLKQALAAASPGDTVTVVATDAGAWRDIPAFVGMSQHRLLSQTEQDAEYRFCVQKGE